MEKNERVPVKVVKTALDALDFLLRSPDGAALREVAGHLGIQATTARNILRTMEACGYVGRNEINLYVTGAKCRDFSRGGARCAALVLAATGSVRVLAHASGESFVLATLVGGDRRALVSIQGSQSLCVNPSAAETDGGISYYATVTARVMLAFASGEERNLVVERHGLPGAVWPRADSPRGFANALESIRRAGFAEDKPGGQRAAFAVPVMDSEKNLLGALGCHIPLSRFTKKRRDELLEKMKNTVSDILSVQQ